MNCCCICGDDADHPKDSFHFIIGDSVNHYCHKHSFIGERVYKKLYSNKSNNIIDDAISHFKYGITHDVYSEPVTSYAELAIIALEKLKND